MSRNWVCVVLAFALLLLSAPLFAATQNAVVYGTVYDAPGNPMPGVTVILENPALAFSRTTTTGSDGSYNFAEVPPSDGYKLTALKGNKKLDIRAGITVNVGDERIILPPLKEQAAAAAQQEVVEKKAEARAVAPETASSSVSGVITADQLRSLPLYNRNFLALGLLTPETHDVPQGSPLVGASFSISGNRPSTNNFLLDGSDNVASSSNQAIPFQVNDSIQEFRVIAADATAEYGRGQGGVVNVVTRRAGNAFHGSAYGYFASDSFNADSPLSVYNGTTFAQAAAYAGSPTVDGTNFNTFPVRYNDYVNVAQNFGFCTNSIISVAALPGGSPSLCVGSGAGANTFFDPAAILSTRNNFKQPFDGKQFGGSAGGALIKDKLFLFGSYEGTRIDNPNPIFERVPSAFDKTYNPLNGPTVSGGGFAFPRFLFDPTSPDYLLAQGVLGLFPASNVVGVPGVLEFFQGEAPNYTHVHNGLLRLDWVMSAHTTLGIRYVSQVLNQLHDDSLPVPVSASGYPGNGAVRHAFNQNLSVGMTHSFSPSVINEIRVGFNRFNVHETAQDSSFDARTLGVAGGNFPNRAMPTILLNGLDPQYSGAYLGVDGAYGNWNEILNALFTSVPMGPSTDSLFPFARIGAPLNTPSTTIDTTIFGADSLSFSHGRHGMKIGFEIRSQSNQIVNGAYQRGFVYSANIGEFGHDSETCNEVCGLFGFASSNAFLRPSFDLARMEQAPFAGNFRSWIPAFFFQDTWRVSPRVTVNMGVRYEYFSTPKDRQGRTWNFDPAAGGLVPSSGNAVPSTTDPFGNGCDPAGVVSATYNGAPAWFGYGVNFFGFPLGSPGITLPPWTNCTPSGNPTTVPSEHRTFAPRFGVAWDPSGTGKTVVRLGVGMFWDQLPVNYLSQLIYNRPDPTSVSLTAGIEQPNAFYGQMVDNFSSFFGGFGLSFSPCPPGLGSFLGFGSAQCGLGNSIINPAQRALTNMDGFPFSFDFHQNGFWSNAVEPFAIYARDTANAHTPLSVQLNFSVQRQLSNKLMAEIGYVGNLGRNLPTIYNANYANEFNPFTAGIGATGFFPVYVITNQAESNYHSVVARLRAADWHGLRLNATYTFSRSLDNSSGPNYPPEPITLGNLAISALATTNNPVSGCLFAFSFCQPGTLSTTPFPNINFSTGAVTTTGAGQVLVSSYGMPQDPFHFLSNEQGRSDFDVTHRLVLDYTWDVPSVQKRWGWSKWLDYWQFSGIFTAQTGQPFTIFSGPILGEVYQRVNVTSAGVTTNFSNPAAAISTTGITAPFSTTCGFSFLPAPNTACIGNSRRNQFTGPNFINFDMSIQKGFPLFGESKMLTVRAEFYNLMDRANYYNPISQFSTNGTNLNPFFGQILSAHNPRQIQFGARFTW